MTVARDDLYLGVHHLFRGRLSMTGDAIYALNNYCCDELEKLDLIISDEKSAMIRATKEEILDIG
jgi:hypothetical protein